ncbi:hypothetical protein [Chelativorans sp.]|uniref:hypothetical protein n=1 Tax=Chelativorans sp. TaxID=2203393 RepID=UPI002810CC9C|nr:hypothetical protein [Chelativorans sp.]
MGYLLFGQADRPLKADDVLDHPLEFPWEVPKYLRHKLAGEDSEFPGTQLGDPRRRRDGAAALDIDIEAPLPRLFQLIAFGFMEQTPTVSFLEYVQPGIDRRAGHDADEVLLAMILFDGGITGDRQRRIQIDEFFGQAREFADLDRNAAIGKLPR